MSEKNKDSKKEKNAKILINEVKQTVKKELSVNVSLIIAVVVGGVMVLRVVIFQTFSIIL